MGAALGVGGDTRGTQREGSRGWSREPQVEGKGRVGSTKIMPHQPLIETALVKYPNFSPGTTPRDGPQGKEWDRASSVPTKHSYHLSHLCQNHLPQPSPAHLSSSIPQHPEKHRFPHSTPHPSLLLSPPAAALQHRLPLMSPHVPSSQGTPGRGQNTGWLQGLVVPPRPQLHKHQGPGLFVFVLPSLPCSSALFA